MQVKDLIECWDQSGATKFGELSTNFSVVYVSDLGLNEIAKFEIVRFLYKGSKRNSASHKGVDQIL